MERWSGADTIRRPYQRFSKEVETMTMPSKTIGASAPFPYANQEEARLALHARVANALRWSLAIPRNRIDVRVEGDRVTLRGIVERTYEKLCAEALAERVPGIVGVRNEIEVRPENHL
jgi:osmotically-inducible protein OsmY